jgi:Tfp pilus assembly protein PilN
MPKPLTYDFNLIPKDPFFESTLGRILVWATNAGRYILIFTEFIVIISFVARFTLDRRLADLNKDISQKANLIKSQSQLESDFRLAQVKLDNFSKLDQQTNVAEVFPLIQQIVPRNVVLEKLKITQQEVEVESIALSNEALNYFISNLQLSPHFHNIQVSKIETREEDQIGFRVLVSAAYKIPEKE